MIFVDSSVWINYFNGVVTPETEYLDSLLGVEQVAIGDLVLMEVLQGFRQQRHFERAKELLLELEVYELLGTARAIKAAEHYRELRRKGITVRKSNDIIIGSFCIETSTPLLFSDRDFDQMQKYLGLKNALPS